MGWLWFGLAAAVNGAAPNVRYAPPPAWVAPPPPGTSATPLPGAPIRTIYYDQQVHAGTSGSDLYTAYRVRILAPEALSIGNVAVTWNPATDQISVHRLRIHREGRVIDVLAGQKFAVIQREANLEQAVLDGVRTATLQTQGLQVGDELEFAATIHSDDPNLHGAAQGFVQLPAQATQGAFRVRASWLPTRNLRWGAKDDLPKPVETKTGAETTVTLTLSDPDTVVTPDEAPPRFAIHRLFQFTTFPDWSAVSRELWPLFDAAARRGGASPLKAQADAIAAASTDPATRAEAALRLVEERIRYVYVGLDRANYRPAPIDDTWERRFGDCKAKTVMLIALLRDLGIAAEPVLVSSTGGDGIDQRLPTTQVFDHVVVRATIAGTAYWLDATRLGDRSLELLPPPVSRWALPLRAAGAALEPIAPVPPKTPLQVLALDVDASGGFDQPAKVKATQVLRGDEAYQVRTQLAALATADAQRAVAAWWRRSADWVTATATGWRVSPKDDALVLSLEGTGKLDWEGDAKNGRSLTIFGAGFTPPAEMKRPKDQNQAAPWALTFPRYRCWATTIRLPTAGATAMWTYSSKPVDRRFGGEDLYREALLDKGVMRTVMSRRNAVPEISAAEAARTNAGLPSFDNNMSQVSESPRLTTLVQPSRREAAFLSAAIDWTAPDAPCRAPERRP